MRNIFLFALILMTASANCAEARGIKKMNQIFSITSPAFKDSQTIPFRYSGRGENLNPALEISGIPGGTKSLVLIMDDIDAPGGTFDHWIMFNVSPRTTKIYEGTTPVEANFGVNSAGSIGYYGPNPPPGKAHHYTFRLFALDSTLQLKNGADRADIESAMAKHVIGKAELVGLFGR